MDQLICDYTRVTNVSHTIIDLIFVSRPELVVSSGVHSLGLSDHSLVYVVRKHKQVKLPPRTVKSRCFKHFNDERFVSSVANIDWDQITCIDDVNSALNKWQLLFTGICDSQAPFKEKRIKGYLPEWVNHDFLKFSKDRDYYYAKAHKTNDQVYWNKAKTLRNKVNNMKFYLKKNYYNKAINDNINNSKNLWKVIKKIIPNKSSPVPNNIELSDDGLPSSKGTANAFNNYFSSIGNTLGEKFNTTCNDDKPITCPCNNSCSKFNKNPSDSKDKFKFCEITHDFVYNQIIKMSNDKSPGLDQFSVELLKLAAPYISKSLAYICKLSMKTSIFPDDWKKAKVTPIFKSGDRSDVGNYRPISILPIVSKIIERAVHNQLYAYISKHDLLSDAQSGFRTKHSTTTTLLDVQDYILTNMDGGYVTGAIFLDLKKAFDTVNHDILIDKLNRYGIDGNELTWFKSYLCDRSQTVNINSCLSEFNNINIGVPQGSILGPLLFIIFVNCLPGAVDCKTIMYADDTTLLYKSKNPNDLSTALTSNIRLVSNWLEANKLTLNIDKTKVMIFGTTYMLDKCKDVSLTYDNTLIETVSELKYLGVKFDNTMSWTSHVNYLSKNVSKRIGIIRRVKHFLPHCTLEMLSKALVISHFDYASPVWSNCSQTCQTKLQTLHNRLARVILSADIRTPVNDMMHDLNWLKLSDRWNIQMLIIVFKCLRGISPSYLCSKFDFVHNHHLHATRNHTSNTLFIPKVNSNSGMRTFLVRSSHLWNNLATTIRTDFNNMSICEFKTCIST